MLLWSQPIAPTLLLWTHPDHTIIEDGVVWRFIVAGLIVVNWLVFVIKYYLLTYTLQADLVSVGTHSSTRVSGCKSRKRPETFGLLYVPTLANPSSNASWSIQIIIKVYILFYVTSSLQHCSILVREWKLKLKCYAEFLCNCFVYLCWNMYTFMFVTYHNSNMWLWKFMFIYCHLYLNIFYEPLTNIPRLWNSVFPLCSFDSCLLLITEWYVVTTNCRKFVEDICSIVLVHANKHWCIYVSPGLQHLNHLLKSEAVLAVQTKLV